MSNDADNQADTGSDETRPIGAQIINAFTLAYDKGVSAVVVPFDFGVHWDFQI